MYIEQGRKGHIGLWKYIFPPLIFLSLMVYNYVSTMDIDIESFLNEQIESLGKPLFFFINMMLFVFFLLALFFWVKFIHHQRITTLTTSRQKIDWKRVFFMFGLMGLFICVMTFIGYQMAPEDYEWNFKLKPFLLLFVMAIVLIPFQTSFEEYMFRGYMMQGIGLATRTRWIPLVVTSVIFGVMHMGNPEVGKLGPIIMVYYIGTGFFLGIITLMDEGLELALGFHAANNLIGVLLVTSSWSALQADSVLINTAQPEKGLDVLIPVFVVFPIMLFILYKKYKWSGWKDKLFGNVLPEMPIKES